LTDIAGLIANHPDNVVAHINVFGLSPVKVRTTLAGEKKSWSGMIWGRTKIKGYDRGVQMNSREGVRGLQITDLESMLGNLKPKCHTLSVAPPTMRDRLTAVWLIRGRRGC
jgi:hypothetical protein